MLSKNQIKFITSLKQKKIREQEDLFIAEGTKVVTELLRSSIVVKQIFSLSEFFKTINSIPNNAEWIEIKPAELQKISNLTTPNEVLAVCEIPKDSLQVRSLEDKLTMVLDDIRDPGNLGTIIRIADWFGIETIICSSTTVDMFNSKVVQSTMGSIARVKVHYTDLLKFFESTEVINLKMPIYGTVIKGENIYKQKLSNRGFVVIGNESNGISKEILKLVTHKISIPAFAIDSSVESLNAAIATAVVCAEFRRQNETYM